MSWQADSRLRVPSSSTGFIWIKRRISDALMSRTIRAAARPRNRSARPAQATQAMYIKSIGIIVLPIKHAVRSVLGA
jgi:hypothetical protein